MDNILVFVGVAVSFAVTLWVVWVVIAPLFFSTEGAGESCSVEAQSMSAKREELLAFLEEVETDKLSGKLTPEEYAVNRADALQNLLGLVESKKSE